MKTRGRKEEIVVLILLILLFAPAIVRGAGSITASATVNPSSFMIARGTGGAQILNYTLKTTPQVDVTLTSTYGVFFADGHEVGRIDVPLTASVLNGTGHVSETITFSSTLIKRAEKRGVTRLKFKRTFDGVATLSGRPVPVTVTAEVTIVVTTGAGAELRITRMQLYFENRRPEITVKRNYPSLRAYAEISFTGSGLIEGYWEVDGRILSNIKRHVVYGRSVIFQTPAAPPIPTFETGTHVIRFVLTSAPEVPLPEAIYYVTSEEFIKTFFIRLISPEDKSVIEYLPPEFRWEEADGVVVYLIEFYEYGSDKPLFSAYTRREEYIVPEIIFGRIFKPGVKYYWRVKGFGRNDEMTGESKSWEFAFKRLRAYVPGELLVGTNRADRANIIGMLKKNTTSYCLMPLKSEL